MLMLTVIHIGKFACHPVYSSVHRWCNLIAACCSGVLTDSTIYMCITIIIVRLPNRFRSPEQPTIYEYKYELLNSIKARFPCHGGNDSETADA